MRLTLIFCLIFQLNSITLFAQNIHSSCTCLEKLSQSTQTFKWKKTQHAYETKKTLFKKAFAIPVQIHSVATLKLYPIADTIIMEIKESKRTRYLRFFCDENGVIAVQDDHFFSYSEVALIQLFLAEIDFDNKNKTLLPTINYEPKPNYFTITDTVNYYAASEIKQRYEGATFELKKDTTIRLDGNFQTNLQIKGMVKDSDGRVENLHENDLQLYFTKDKYPFRIVGKMVFYHCTPAYRRGRNIDVELTLVKSSVIAK